MSSFDAIQLGILWSKMRAIADEAAANIVKTAVSTSVGISQDFAFSILDSRGRLLACGVPSVAQFSALLPRTMRMVLERFPLDQWEPNDVVMTTDPWISAGHAYDLVLVTPAFKDDKLVAFTVSLAHTADIGGTLALSGSKDMYEEGLVLPLVKVYKAGVVNDDVLDILKANIRVPDIMMGDFHAMTAANELAGRRLAEVLRDYDLPDYVELTDELEAFSERAIRAAVKALPDGRYPYELHIDGIRRPVKLFVTMVVEGEELTVDYTGTDEQRPDEALNAVLNFTFSETVTAVQSVLTPTVPFNEGFLRAVKIVAPEGTVLNCTKPVPVKNRDKVVGHIEPLIFGALHPVVPDKVLAPSGSIYVTIANGIDSRTGRVFNTYISEGSGTGGGVGYDGVNCLHFPWGSRNIPVELIENRSPLLIRAKRIRPDSGGPGEFRGGCGQETLVTTLPSQQHHVALALYSDHLRFAPEGIAGGEPGGVGGYVLDGEVKGPESKEVVDSFLYLQPGSELAVLLPGGGGYGNARDREPAAVAADVRAGVVSAEAARERYGVVVDEDGLVDNEATERERQAVSTSGSR